LEARFPDLFTPSMSAQEKFDLARSVGEECVQDEELLALFERKLHPVVYDGFEPSGRMHIAQGVQRAINTNKLTSCGFFVKFISLIDFFLLLLFPQRCIFKFWVADWFALMNNKMGGDLEKIRTVGYFFFFLRDHMMWFYVFVISFFISKKVSTLSRSGGRLGWI